MFLFFVYTAVLTSKKVSLFMLVFARITINREGSSQLCDCLHVQLINVA